MLITAILQAVIVALSGSVALMADTIHNVGDGATAFPLWIAFRVGQRPPDRRFTYGYGRVEDLAGVAVVFTILFSALVAGYESINRLLHPQPVTHLWAIVAAAVIGFAGNEAVAIFRIRVGRAIGSAALVADGYHARVDGLTSLAVLFGAVGVWLGFPLADPLIGLVITVTILKIVWESGRSIFTRLLDGVDPSVIDEIEHAAHHVTGVTEVTGIRARWVGHQLQAELAVAVRSELSVEDGHRIARDVRHELLHHLDHLSEVTVHVDPASAPGVQFHRIPAHEHDGLAAHAHF